MKGGWTESVQKIQSLSNLCPNSVKCLSNDKQSTRSVQSLSTVCRDPVQTQGQLTDFGHGNPVFVQTLSIRAFAANELSDCVCILDKLSTQTDSRQTLDLSSCPLPTYWLLVPCLDKVWTNFGLGQTLDKTRICQLAPLCLPGQSLDKLWTWTDFRQTLNLSTCPLPTHWLLVACLDKV